MVNKPTVRFYVVGNGLYKETWKSDEDRLNEDHSDLQMLLELPPEMTNTHFFDYVCKEFDK